MRSRVGADRRIVTLRSGDGVQAVADTFFDPLGARFRVVMASYPAETLTQFETLVSQLGQTMRDYAAEVSAAGSTNAAKRSGKG